MILIADSGSTKTDWCLVNRNGLIKRAVLQGANPYFRSGEDIGKEIKEVLLPELRGNAIDSVFFYGAGCAFPEKIKIVHEAISDNFKTKNIVVGSDLLGAAIGLCKDTPGIVCILGTGSNSCYYDGTEIKKNISPLGFILGDEGSGAVIGKLFTGACLKNQLTEGLKEKFLIYQNLTQEGILDRVYKQAFPNRFLAGLLPFIKDHMKDKTVRDLVCNAFVDFFRKNVMQYDYQNYPVYFTGSVALHFESLLSEVSGKMGISITSVVQSPMEELIKYYTKVRFN